MASQTDICNLALVKLGAKTIMNLQDTTTSAQVLSALYTPCLEAELAAHPWTFAMTRALLPADVTPPAFGWGYAYRKPTGFLKLVEVGEHWCFYPNNRDPLFAIEGAHILTDQGSPLKMRYVQRITDAGLLPPLFVQAFACRLAFEACEKLTQNLSKRQEARDERKEAVRDARRTNDIEQPPQQPPMASWELSLLGLDG